MKRVVWIAMVAGFLVSMFGQAFALDVTGSWNSRDEFKATIQFKQQGNKVSATYPQDRGELVGEMFGNRFQGFWIEDNSNRRCSIPVNGRYYWGNMTIDYSGDSSMTGVWGYCFDTPTRRFNGDRADRSSSFSPPITEGANIGGAWKTSEGDLFLNHAGENVTGIYTKDNGEVVGRFRGNVLTGYWIENASNRRCSSPKNGRYYWGRLRLAFMGNKFQGVWGYCEDEPRQSWTGQR